MSFLKRLAFFFSTELGFFVVLASLLLGLSISPQIKRQLDTPSDRIFSGLEFYSDDYSIYVSNIFQGMRGRWTLLDKHTSEPHQGTIIHNEYLLWGKLIGLFGFDAITAYHLARYTFGLILLIIVYLFIKEIFPLHQTGSDLSPKSQRTTIAKRKLAFFLVCFSAGFVIINRSASGISFDFHINWMTELDVFYRFVALPHYLLGNIFFLSSLINFLRVAHSKYNLFFGSLSAFLLALVHPVALVSLLALLGTYLFFSTLIKFSILLNDFRHSEKISNLKFKIFQSEYLFFICCLFVSLPVMLFFRSQFFVPPWNHMAAWEGVTQYYLPLSEFALAVGPTFFLGIIGLVGMFFSAFLEFKILLLLLSWPLSFFLLFYFSYPFLHISQVRFMQVFLFIPFAVLSAEGIFFLSRLFGMVLKLINLKLLKNSKFQIRNYSLLFFIILIVLICAPGYYHSLSLKYRFFTDFSPLVYPLKGTVEGYNFLRDKTNPNEVVLAGFLSGTQIPYFSNNTVYTGHLWATLNRQEKETLQNKFLTNKMTESEALAFFRQGRIRYFFNGWQEASYGIKPERYSFLKPVFQNQQVVIYQAIY